MGFDWKKIEREDEERHSRAALWMGVAYVTLAVIGLMAALLTRRWESIIGVIAWVIVGGGLLLGYRLKRNRRA